RSVIGRQFLRSFLGLSSLGVQVFTPRLWVTDISSFMKPLLIERTKKVPISFQKTALSIQSKRMN
ncbi:hypothetical protein, partial [Thiolapillus sp.]|uniref:hypothetical protein n=1 Tax=Thiolapillus sp. TaxID=2017437 RepID=UPI0025CE156A